MAKLTKRIIEWDDSKKDHTGESIWKSGPKTEYLIVKDNRFWILSYVDFWTLPDHAFIVNIKKHESDPWAVHELKEFAEIVHTQYLAHKNKPNITNEQEKT